MMSLASHESTAPTPHTLTTLTMSSLPPQNASPPLGFLNAEDSTKMTLANLAPSPETNEQGYTHPYNGGPNHVPSPPSDSQELDTLQQRSAHNNTTMTGGMCVVCGDTAPGDKIFRRHYGVICCEACKCFFRRTVQMSRDYKCRFGSNCTIGRTPVNMKQVCQACRFQQCIRAGMKMDSVKKFPKKSAEDGSSKKSSKDGKSKKQHAVKKEPKSSEETQSTNFSPSTRLEKPESDIDISESDLAHIKFNISSPPESFYSVMAEAGVQQLFNYDSMENIHERSTNVGSGGSPSRRLATTTNGSSVEDLSRIPNTSPLNMSDPGSIMRAAIKKVRERESANLVDSSEALYQAKRAKMDLAHPVPPPPLPYHPSYHHNTPHHPHSTTHTPHHSTTHTPLHSTTHTPCHSHPSSRVNSPEPPPSHMTMEPCHVTSGSTSTMYDTPYATPHATPHATPINSPLASPNYTSASQQHLLPYHHSSSLLQPPAANPAHPSMGVGPLAAVNCHRTTGFMATNSSNQLSTVPSIALPGFSQNNIFISRQPNSGAIFINSPPQVPFRVVQMPPPLLNLPLVQFASPPLSQPSSSSSTALAGLLETQLASSSSSSSSSAVGRGPFSVVPIPSANRTPRELTPEPDLPTPCNEIDVENDLISAPPSARASPTMGQSMNDKHQEAPLEQVLDSLRLRISSMFKWAKSEVAGFEDLSPLDQKALLRRTVAELVMLGFARGSIAYEGMLLLGSTGRVIRPTNANTGVATVASVTLMKLVVPLKVLNINDSELTLLKEIVLFNPESSGLRNKEVVRAYRKRKHIELMEYTEKNSEDPGRFGDLLCLLTPLFEVSTEVTEQLRLEQFVYEGEARIDALLLMSMINGAEETLESPMAEP